MVAGLLRAPRYWQGVTLPIPSRVVLRPAASRLLLGRLVEDRLVEVLERGEVTIAEQGELVDKQEEVTVVGVEVGCGS